MTGISVGAALGEGFGLIRRKPLTVLAWGAVMILLQLATFTLFAPYYLTVYGAFIDSLVHQTPLPITALSSPDIRRTQGLLELFNLVQLFAVVVVYCASFRAVLHPERSSFAYLRVGAPEVLLSILAVAGFVALIIAMVIVLIPVGIILGIVVAATHGGGAAILVAVPILMVVMACVVLFLAARFALVGPMMVEDGRFHLFESWTLTRGRVGSLMLVGLGLFVFLLVADIVLLALLVAGGAAVAHSVGGLGPALALLRGPPQAALAKLAPVFAVYLIIHLPLAGCVVAIAGAPWAKAYRDLLPEAAHVFA